MDSGWSDTLPVVTPLGSAVTSSSKKMYSYSGLMRTNESIACRTYTRGVYRCTINTRSRTQRRYSRQDNGKEDAEEAAAGSSARQHSGHRLNLSYVNTKSSVDPIFLCRQGLLSPSYQEGPITDLEGARPGLPRLPSLPDDLPGTRAQVSRPTVCIPSVA